MPQLSIDSLDCVRHAGTISDPTTASHGNHPLVRIIRARAESAGLYPRNRPRERNSFTGSACKLALLTYYHLSQSAPYIPLIQLMGFTASFSPKHYRRYLESRSKSLASSYAPAGFNGFRTKVHSNIGTPCRKRVFVGSDSRSRKPSWEDFNHDRQSCAITKTSTYCTYVTHKRGYPTSSV